MKKTKEIKSKSKLSKEPGIKDKSKISEKQEIKEEIIIPEEIKSLEDEDSAKQKKEIEAIVHIYTSYNNTLAHVTDMSGRTIAKVTGGMVTKQDRLKANPTIAMFIAKRIAEKMKEEGIKLLYIRIRAKTGNPSPGPGANALVKSLSREGFRIINILDVTRMPRGGPKKKGGRRGRRP